MSEYTAEENIKYYWVPSIGNPEAPTVAEMSAAIELSCQIARFPDVKATQNTVERPSLCSNVVLQVPSTVSLPTGEMAFHMNDTTPSDAATILATLTDGAQGNLVRVDRQNGTVPSIAAPGTVLTQVVPMTIGYVDVDSPEWGTIVTWAVPYAVTAKPGRRVAVVP